MTLLKSEEFQKAEQVLANLLVGATDGDQARILLLHDRLKTIFAAQSDRRAQLDHLLSLTEKTVQ